MVSHKGINNNQDVPSECHHASICDGKRVGQRGKSDFCPQATKTNHFSSFPWISQKEYFRSWDRSHQRASSGLLRASTTKGRNTFHFQSDQVLHFWICVLHIDRRHSHDKDSLSGCWPLRQAPVRVTSSLWDIPGARALSSSHTCCWS